LTSHKPEPWSPTSGQAARWIALHLELHAPHTWFGPTWAFLGGVVSCGQAPLTAAGLVIVLVAWLVSEPFLGSLLALAADIAAMRQAGRADPLAPRRWSLPYVRPGTPGQRLLDYLARVEARFRHGWHIAGEAGEKWLFLAIATLLLSLIAGGPAALLAGVMVVAALGVTTLRPLSASVRVGLGAMHFFVSWLIGRVTLGALDYRVAAVGAGFALVWFAWTLRPPRAWLLALAELATAALLVLWHAPVAAVGILLLAAPLFALWPDGPTSQRGYLAHTQAFLMASLLLAAGGLAWSF